MTTECTSLSNLAKPLKSLLKEAVDNALDACEEAAPSSGILWLMFWACSSWMLNFANSPKKNAQLP